MKPHIFFGLLVGVICLLLAFNIHMCDERKRSAPVPADATSTDDATAVVLALRCMRSVEPGWIELRHLAAMAGATPGTLALELSGNPSVEYREGPAAGVRYYRFVKGTP